MEPASTDLTREQPPVNAVPGHATPAASSDDVPGVPAAPGVHPALAAAYRGLDDAAIAGAVLRGTGHGDEDEIDMLVAPADVPRIATVLRSAGFAPVPAIGHGQHRFFRAYDETSDRWLTLDVVNRLGFGSDGALELDVAATVLERRQSGPLPARLAPDDAFWALLLHDLLDRGDVPAGHRAQLDALVGSARPDGTIGSAVDRRAGTTTAAALLGRVRAGDLDGARRAARPAAARWRRRSIARWAARRLAGSVQRRLRKAHTAFARRGVDVAILGPDGAGKSRVAASLIASSSLPTRSIYLGLYAAGLDRPGRLGLIRRLGRLWRGWLSGAWHRLRGRIVIYDRHALDAAITAGDRSRKRRLRRWVLAHAIPGPALIVVLDAPGELLHQRSGEHDSTTLERQRQGYLVLAGRRGAVVIDASADPHHVHRAVTAAIWRRWTSR